MPSKSNTTKSLIIWDKDSKFELPGKEYLLINSENELKKIKWHEINVVYILAELGSGWGSRTEFCGFKVAKNLRLDNKLTCPTVFCSFLSKTQLYNFPESKILRRPGHYYLRLPDEKPKGEYEGIDEDMLEDINGDLFDKHEFIQNRIHDIKDILVEKASHDRIDVLDILKVELIPVKEVFCESVSINKWAEVENELIDKVKSVLDKDGFQPYNLFGAFNSEDITRFFPKDEHETSPDWPHRRWQVLFIEDKEETRNQLKALFAERNIVCLSSGNADEAFEKLKEDAEKDNLISAVISDYRLYENGDLKSDLWQELQGPQILKHIHYHPDFKKHYAYAILTAKRNAISRHISKPEKFHIHWFNKADVLADGNHGFNLFCSRIIEIGSEAFYRKYETPYSAVWTHGNDRVKPGLSFYYRLHVESFDYEEAEKKIVAVVLTEIENIKKNKPLNDNYEYQCSLNYETSNGNEVELLKKFRKNILIPRRIIWYLLNEELKDVDEIFKLFDDFQQNDDEDNTDRRKKALYNNSLGISIKLKQWIKTPQQKVFYPGILFEERKFIEKYTESNIEITESHDEIEGSFIACQSDYSILRNFFIDIGGTEDLLVNSTLKSYNIFFNYRQKQVDISLISKSVEEIKRKIRNNESLKIKLHDSLIDFYENQHRYKNLKSQKLREILKKSNFE